MLAVFVHTADGKRYRVLQDPFNGRTATSVMRDIKQGRAVGCGRNPDTAFDVVFNEANVVSVSEAGD